MHNIQLYLEEQTIKYNILESDLEKILNDSKLLYKEQSDLITRTIDEMTQIDTRRNYLVRLLNNQEQTNKENNKNEFI